MSLFLSNYLNIGGFWVRMILWSESLGLAKPFLRLRLHVRDAILAAKLSWRFMFSNDVTPEELHYATQLHLNQVIWPSYLYSVLISGTSLWVCRKQWFCLIDGDGCRTLHNSFSSSHSPSGKRRMNCDFLRLWTDYVVAVWLFATRKP